MGCFKDKMKALSHWYAELVIRRPVLGMFILMLIPIIFSGIAMVAYPIQMDTSANAFVPRGSDIGKVEQTILVGEESTRFNPFREPSDTDSVSVVQQSDNRYALTIYFHDESGGDVLTEERLKLVQRVEQRIQAQSNFTDFCLKYRGSDDCAKPLSMTSYVFASNVTNCSTVDPDGRASTPWTDVKTAIRAVIDPSFNLTYCTASGNECNNSCIVPEPDKLNFAVEASFGYANESDTTEDPVLTSNMTTTTFFFGLPLKGYINADDRQEEQLTEIENFILDIQIILEEEYDDPEGVRVLPLSPIVIVTHFESIILRDTLPVMASIIIVWLYMWFHTQSLFTASFGMLHVVLSFPVAYLFMQAVLGVGAMGMLNFMALFIILGIGADDIFIFVDAWKQSAHEIPRKTKEGKVVVGDASTQEEEDSEENLEWLTRRLMWAHRRSAKAMLITSLTTGAAFLMNLSSELPAIQVFGFFTALMIFINYLEVITYFPFVVLVQQRYFSHNKTCLCFNLPCCPAHDKEHSTVKEVDEKQLKEAGDQGVRENIDDYRLIERFFHNKFTPFIHKFRYYILLFFAAFLILTAIFAAQLESDDKPTQWVPASDPIQKVLDLGNTAKRSDQARQLFIIHGLKILDQSDVNPYNSDSIGLVQFDDNFDPSAESAQLEYIAMCNRFRDEEYVLSREVYCPMESIKTYFEDIEGGTFPIPQADFVDVVANYTLWHETTFGPAEDFTDGDQTADTRQTRRQSLAKESQTVRFGLDTTSPDLKYMVTVVNTTLDFLDPAAVIRPVYEHWSKVLENENGRTTMQAATLGNGLQTMEKYVDLQVEDTLLRAAVIGIAASMALSFVVIFLSTQDLVISFYSILNIGLTVVALIAFMVWFGWKLSIIESICMTILVGLSVDYVIHLANAYKESKHHTRYERLQDAMTVMGISVLSASITTFLSAIILFFTYILFFFKFGVFISMTILLSAIYSFFFFTALSAAIGRNEKHNDFLSFWYFITCKKPTPPKSKQDSTKESTDVVAMEEVTGFDDNDGQKSSNTSEESENHTDIV